MRINFEEDAKTIEALIHNSYYGGGIIALDEFGNIIEDTKGITPSLVIEPLAYDTVEDFIMAVNLKSNYMKIK
jgi:hypothetical protein